MPIDALAANETLRHRILGAVRNRPGTTSTNIARRLGCTQPTVSYHLNILRQQGHIQCERSGREIRNYPAKEMGKAVRLQAILRDQRKNKIAQFLHGLEDGVLGSINQMVHDLDMPYGFVKRTLNQLQELHYIQIYREPGRCQVYVSRALESDLYTVSQ